MREDQPAARRGLLQPQVARHRVGRQVRGIPLRRHAHQDIRDSVVLARKRVSLSPHARASRRHRLRSFVSWRRRRRLIDRDRQASRRRDRHRSQRVVMARDAAGFLEKRHVRSLEEREAAGDRRARRRRRIERQFSGGLRARDGCPRLQRRSTIAVWPCSRARPSAVTPPGPCALTSKPRVSSVLTTIDRERIRRRREHQQVQPRRPLAWTSPPRATRGRSPHAGPSGGDDDAHNASQQSRRRALREQLHAPVAARAHGERQRKDAGVLYARAALDEQRDQVRVPDPRGFDERRQRVTQPGAMDVRFGATDPGAVARRPSIPGTPMR